MKKLIFLALVIVSNSVMALPVGNPSAASLATCGRLFEDDCFGLPVSLRVGFYGDYVYDHHLKFTRLNAMDPMGARIDRSLFSTNAALITLNGFNRVDFFTTLGTTSFTALESVTDAGVVARLKTGFSWSVGGRATLVEYGFLSCGVTSLGIEGQYFKWNSAIDTVIINAGPTLQEDIDVEKRAWQVGMGVSQRIWNFVPYVAGKYNRVKLFAEGGTIIKNDKRWGWAVGVSLLDCCLSFVTVEARFGNETALHVNGEIRF